MNLENIDWWKMSYRALIALLIGTSLVGGCSALNQRLGLSDDHFIEERAEDLIEDQTGLDLDLTPESEED